MHIKQFRNSLCSAPKFILGLRFHRSSCLTCRLRVALKTREGHLNFRILLLIQLFNWIFALSPWCLLESSANPSFPGSSALRTRHSKSCPWTYPGHPVVKDYLFHPDCSLCGVPVCFWGVTGWTTSQPVWVWVSTVHLPLLWMWLSTGTYQAGPGGQGIDGKRSISRCKSQTKM